MTMTNVVPALSGWYSLERERPHLIGSRCVLCGTYYFPRSICFCRNPACEGTVFEEIPLSRTGKIWSYTNACYKPPEPYVSGDPFTPFSIAAVELEIERMVVLGQVVAGIGIDQLKIGMPVELALEPLYVRDSIERVVWKWKPTGSMS